MAEQDESARSGQDGRKEQASPAFFEDASAGSPSASGAGAPGEGQDLLGGSQESAVFPAVLAASPREHSSKATALLHPSLPNTSQTEGGKSKVEPGSPGPRATALASGLSSLQPLAPGCPSAAGPGIPEPGCLVLQPQGPAAGGTRRKGFSEGPFPSCTNSKSSAADQNCVEGTADYAGAASGLTLRSAADEVEHSGGTRAPCTPRTLSSSLDPPQSHSLLAGVDSCCAAEEEAAGDDSLGNYSDSGAETTDSETAGAETAGAGTEGSESEISEAESATTKVSQTEGAVIEGSDTGGADTEGSETGGAETEGAVTERGPEMLGDILKAKLHSGRDRASRSEASSSSDSSRGSSSGSSTTTPRTSADYSSDASTEQPSDRRGSKNRDQLTPWAGRGPVAANAAKVLRDPGAQASQPEGMEAVHAAAGGMSGTQAGAAGGGGGVHASPQEGAPCGSKPVRRARRMGRPQIGSSAAHSGEDSGASSGEAGGRLGELSQAKAMGDGSPSFAALGVQQSAAGGLSSWDPHLHDFAPCHPEAEQCHFPQTTWAAVHSAASLPAGHALAQEEVLGAAARPPMCPMTWDPHEHDFAAGRISLGATPFPLTNWAATQLPAILEADSAGGPQLPAIRTSMTLRAHDPRGRQCLQIPTQPLHRHSHDRRPSPGEPAAAAQTALPGWQCSPLQEQPEAAAQSAVPAPEWRRGPPGHSSGSSGDSSPLNSPFTPPSPGATPGLPSAFGDHGPEQCPHSKDEVKAELPFLVLGDAAPSLHLAGRSRTATSALQPLHGRPGEGYHGLGCYRNAVAEGCKAHAPPLAPGSWGEEPCGEMFAAAGEGAFHGSEHPMPRVTPLHWDQIPGPRMLLEGAKLLPPAATMLLHDGLGRCPPSSLGHGAQLAAPVTHPSILPLSRGGMQHADAGLHHQHPMDNGNGLRARRGVCLSAPLAAHAPDGEHMAACMVQQHAQLAAYGGQCQSSASGAQQPRAPAQGEGAQKMQHLGQAQDHRNTGSQAASRTCALLIAQEQQQQQHQMLPAPHSQRMDQLMPLAQQLQQQKESGLHTVQQPQVHITGLVQPSPPGPSNPSGGPGSHAVGSGEPSLGSPATGGDGAAHAQDPPLLSPNATIPRGQPFRQPMSRQAPPACQAVPQPAASAWQVRADAEKARRAAWSQRAVYSAWGSSMVFPLDYDSEDAGPGAGAPRGIARTVSETSSAISEPWSMRSAESAFRRTPSRGSLSQAGSESMDMRNLTGFDHSLALKEQGHSGSRFWEIASVAAGAAVLLAGASAIAHGAQRRPPQAAAEKHIPIIREGAPHHHLNAPSAQGKGTQAMGSSRAHRSHRKGAPESLPAGVVQGEEFIYASRPHLAMGANGMFEVIFPRGLPTGTQHSAEGDPGVPAMQRAWGNRAARRAAHTSQPRGQEKTQPLMVFGTCEGSEKYCDLTEGYPRAAHSLHLLKMNSSAPWYEVQPGDTLFKIASSKGKGWQDVAAQNPHITNPDIIYPKDRLLL